MTRFRKILLLLLAAALLFSLSGCGGGAETEHDPNEGRYEAVSADAMGLSLSLDGLFPDGFALELHAAGKAVLYLSGDRYDLKWRCADGLFHAEAADVSLDGTLADGVMVLRDVLDSGVDLTLICAELAGPAPTPEAESAAPVERVPASEEAAPVEPMLDALSSLPLFGAAQTLAMSNRINYGYALVDGGVFYGRHSFASERSTHLMSLRLAPGSFEIGEARSLDPGCSPGCVQKRGERLYYLRYARGEGSSLGVGCVDLGSGAVSVPVEGNCDYLNLVGERLVFTEDNARVVSTDLLGGDRRVLLERAVYYLSMLDGDWMLFQDDADSESLHLYYLPEGLDYKLNDEPSYAPILCGHLLFYAGRSPGDDAFRLCRIDLDAYEADYDAAAGCRVPRFTAERSDRLFGGEFFCDGRLLLPANDGAAVPVEDWRALSDDAYAGFRRAIRFLSDSLCVEEELDPKTLNILRLVVVDRASGSSAVLPPLR